MKKGDFVKQVAEKAETSREAAARIIEAIFDATSGAISEAIRAGEHVAIPGFGRFRSKTRAARKGRNPQTGQEIDIPERTVVQFSAGKGLQDSLAGKASGGSRGGGGTARKSAGGATAKKSAGGSTAKKSAGGSTAKKAAGGATAKKSAGGTAKKTTGATAKKGGGGAAKKSGGATAKKSGSAAAGR